MPRRGIYPGSFNPPTTAHLAISEAAAAQFSLDIVVWSLSTVPLGKESVVHPRWEDRITVIERVVTGSPLLDLQVTDVQLLADLATGFDVLIMGADKWHQICEPHWYGGTAERDAMLAQLPEVAIAGRQSLLVPDHARLDVDDEFAEISSTAARAGATWQMLPAAQAFAEATGAWIDEARYQADRRGIAN